MEGQNSSIPAQLCVTPPRKRIWSPGSVTNAYSMKRRRISMASVDLAHEIPSEVDLPSAAQATVADRFISAPRENALPLNITPRTNRIARTFGLIDDRVLKYADSNSRLLGSQDGMNMHRFQFQRLFPIPPKVSPISAAANLGTSKQFVLALDGPGMPSDPFAYPLSWSKRNAIAVACGRDMYYQDRETRVITHLGMLQKRSYGRLTSVEWSHDTPKVLAAGTSTGTVQLWDADAKTTLRDWRSDDWGAVGGMDWNGDLLAVGASEGTVELFDAREPKVAGRLMMHKCKVHGVRWSPNGSYLATGDHHGVVQVWDARASKALSDADKKGSKMKHNRAPVKALAWCPWKSDLLATGATHPDGRIRIWSINAVPATTPLHTLSLNTSVTSLIWAPHCKELLSTHGTSWQYRSASTPDLHSSTVLPTNVVRARSKYTNSITVHAYPSLKHIVSVAAHSTAVGHSCLSPDGTTLFTVCPAEEAMKMWTIWGQPEKKQTRESAFDKCSIR